MPGHSASEDARKRADDTRPEPGSSARAAPGALLELLGMLETGYQSYTRPGDDPECVAGSVGVPASHMGLRLVDAEGRDVPPGEYRVQCTGNGSRGATFEPTYKALSVKAGDKKLDLVVSAGASPAA